MPANFRADQPTGAGSGTSGAARDDLWEDQQIELHDTSTGMGTSREWILDDAPLGAVATISSPTATPALITPDILGVDGGTYKITLRFDGVSNQFLGDGSVNPQYALKNKTFVLRVTKDSAGVDVPRLYPLPAYLEEDDHSDGIAGQGVAPGKGHAALIVSLRSRILCNSNERCIVAGTQLTATVGFTAIGSTVLDPAELPDGFTATWEVMIETTDGADPVEIRLFNVTTAAVVASSVLSTPLLVPTVLSSTVVLAAGRNIYEAQLRLQTTGAPNRAVCKLARLLFVV